jgi:hypothetical protein
MLWAAPATALLAVIAALSLGIDIFARPEQAVYLYTTTLLGTWGVLLPARALEGRKVDVKVRKLIYLVIGVLVGLAVWVLAGWLGIGPLPTWETGSSEVFRDVAGPAPAPRALGYATYFGLVYLLLGWSRMTARDRDRRFRIVPAAKAALVAGLLGVLWPSPQPMLLTAVGLTALVAQSVTPWSAPAAAYARYAARAARANRRIA